MKKSLLFAAGLLIAAGAFAPVQAKLRMPHIFTDNMVIQSDTLAAVWGKGTPGSKVMLRGSWGAKASATVGRDSIWRTRIATPAPSYEPLTLTIKDGSDGSAITLSNILSGEVWIASGQSNMEMPLRGFWNQPIEGAAEEIAFSRKNGRGIRFVTVPKSGSYDLQFDFAGSWQVADPSTAAEFSALGWFFAKSLRDILDVPVGIVACAHGGAKVEGYEPAELIANYPDRNMEAERNDPKINLWERVGVMYNSMILPIAGYTARGFLWNQGESNVGGHKYYGARQADMLAHWRKLWQNDGMPFYFVELPGWDYGNVRGIDAALFREAQQKAAKTTPGAYIVCTSDLVYPDEPDDIHARNKRSIGERMAWSAATHTYGMKGFPVTCPEYREMKVSGSEATLYFDNAWNGFTPNDALEGFEIAGKDRRFYPADARIDRDRLTIIVSSDSVKDPKAVRYCFRNFAIGKVHDLMGMPLVPFRTDSWEGVAPGDVAQNREKMVQVEGNGFLLSGKPYHYVGTNLWYGPILASTGEGGDRQRLAAELDSLQAIGVDNLRVLAGGDGNRYIDSHIWPTLQKEPGVYDEKLLEGLDYLLAELEKRGMRAVIYLNNAWEWSGGYGTYLEWAGRGEAPVPLRDGYDKYMKHVSAFVTDEKAKALFEEHLRNIVGRINSITGRPYAESPAIMAWQIGNEPRCFADANKEAFRKWLVESGNVIKSIDPNHLVSVGSEGRHGCENDMNLWAAIHNDGAIDYGTIHIWPYNWGWIKPETMTQDVDKACDNTAAYIRDHSKVCAKPIVLEEFGFPRDNMATEPRSATTARDRYYEYVFGLTGSDGPSKLAGVNFWGWGGSAVPKHKSWKQGDPYTGDPAQEDQGLNSVFSADRSTIEIIRRANR